MMSNVTHIRQGQSSGGERAFSDTPETREQPITSRGEMPQGYDAPTTQGIIDGMRMRGGQDAQDAEYLRDAINDLLRRLSEANRDLRHQKQLSDDLSVLVVHASSWVPSTSRQRSE